MQATPTPTTDIPLPHPGFLVELPIDRPRSKATVRTDL